MRKLLICKYYKWSKIKQSLLKILAILIKKGIIKNIPDKILLVVAMNGQRFDIKTHVVTQIPKSIEQLR